MSEEPGDVVRRERFSGGPARGFLSSLAADERIFRADLQVDRAHVVMLAERGIVDADEAGAILGALADVEAAGHGALPDGEDVHAAIETAVIDRAGPVGGKMHTARSRNDEVATCLRHRLRADLLDLAEATVEARAALADVAREHAGTVMPGYTHLQPAQPVTVGHWLCSYESALARDTERLLDAYGRTNRCPLGAAAFAGTTFDVDRERVAALLGFEGVIENSTDAVSARDFLLEAASACTALSVTLSGLAEDLILFANRGFVDLSDDYASTSSIMPQKVNPDTLELVRATAGDAAAGLSGLATALKGLPRAYNRDLQRAHGHAFAAVDAVREATDVAAGAVATADWPEDRLAAAAGEGFSTATGVADLLAAAGVPFRTAHEVVARAAEHLEAAERASGDAASDAAEHLEAAERASGDAASDAAEHLEAADSASGDAASDAAAALDDGDAAAAPEDALAAVEAAAADLLDDPLSTYVDAGDLAAALDPAESVAARDSHGGPAPDAVRDALDRATGRIDADRDTVADRRGALAAAEEALAAEVAGYV